MKVLLETTIWPSAAQPNHVYFFDDSRAKIYAYVPAGTNTPIEFSSPMTVDLRRRKFKEVANIWNYTLDLDVVKGRSWQVVGSRGDVYTVTETDGKKTCTCSGFTFRGRCKHLAEAV